VKHRFYEFLTKNKGSKKLSKTYLIFQIMHEFHFRRQKNELIEIIRAQCQVCNEKISECRVLGGESGNRILKRAMDEITTIDSGICGGPAGFQFRDHLKVCIIFFTFLSSS
jgi:hypothetical protein